MFGKRQMLKKRIEKLRTLLNLYMLNLLLPYDWDITETANYEHTPKKNVLCNSNGEITKN